MERPGFRCHASWAQLYGRVPEAVLDVIAAALGDDLLVIGFELPPGLMPGLSARGIAWIDCTIHPARFMEDLILGMRAGHPAMQQVLLDHAMPEHRAVKATAPLRALAGRQVHLQVPAGATLLVAQLPVDRSMIRDGRFLTAGDLLPDLCALLDRAAGEGPLVWRPHPYGGHDALMQALQARYPQMQPTAAPIYTLLSQESLAGVVSVSSSVGEEARLFGRHRAYGLGPSTPVLYAGDADDGIGHVLIERWFLATDFWRRLMSPVMDVTTCDGEAPSAMPDLLRRSLRMSWGYGDFASDPRLDTLLARALQAEAAVDRMERTLSWRLTRPLRIIAARLRGRPRP